MPSIFIQNLSKNFGAQSVLRQVNLEIAEGELFFLLGPSGCGKTTLLRHVAGFYQPDAGRIYFGNEDVTHVPAHQRGAAMMFQSYALWPHLNVAENVAFGLEERKRPQLEIEKRVEQALDLVKLTGLGLRRISQLSGGQQQRVALARALVIRPHCLLLDEPLSNLDAKLRREMRSEIRRICKEFGLTGIYVTHDRDEALSMADRLAVMNAGQLAQVGTPQDVYRNPANRMVAEFIGETNLIEARVVQPRTDTGYYRVETALGEIQTRPNCGDWQPLMGSRVLISLRPEALSFAALTKASNHFSGHIIETHYLGTTAQYELATACGVNIKVCEINPQTIREPSSVKVTLMAAPEDTVMLPLE